jgi:hypothetical protein
MAGWLLCTGFNMPDGAFCTTDLRSVCRSGSCGPAPPSVSPITCPSFSNLLRQLRACVLCAVSRAHSRSITHAFEAA